MLWGSEIGPRGERWMMRHPRRVSRQEKSEKNEKIQKNIILHNNFWIIFEKKLFYAIF